MGAAGDEPDLEQGQTAGDGNGPAVCILEQVAAQGAVRRGGAAKGDAEIGLFDLAVFDDLKEQLLGLGSLGDDDQAAGAGVQPVAEGRGVQIVLLVLTLLVEVEQSTVEQGVVLGGHPRQGLQACSPQGSAGSRR